MALKFSRRLWVAGAGASLASLACSHPQDKNTAKSPAHVFTDEPLSPGKKSVLVVSPFLQSTHEIWRSLRAELSDEFNVVSIEVDAKFDEQTLKTALHASKAKCVILMGDNASRVFENLQRQGGSTPPAMVLMTSFAENTVRRLKNATGISYEVPGLTSFVTLRRLTERRVDRVGVIFRPELESFIIAQTALAKMEKVEVVGRVIEGEPAPRRVRYALRGLLRKEKVDAIWVLNDSTLLAPDIIRKAWLPESRSRPVPVMVGVASLVNSSLNFGNIAIVPDHGAMGVQAANLLFDIADNHWSVEENRVEVPLSVQTIVDMSRVDDLHLVNDAASLIDREVH